MSENFYDYIIRFDTNKTSPMEVNRILNKVRNLLIKEGFKIEKPAETDSKQTNQTKNVR